MSLNPLLNRGILLLAVVAVLGVSLIFSAIPEVEAKKAEGKSNQKYGKATKHIVCGDKLCSEIKQPKTTGPAFSFGGTLPTYCNDMTIDQLINSGDYLVIDNRAMTSPQNAAGTNSWYYAWNEEGQSWDLTDGSA